MGTIYLIGGLATVVWCASILVGAAESIAYRLRVRPFLVGVTLVAAGTSLPELAVGVIAAWSGEAALVLGNAVGSNVTNILLVLGLGLVLLPASSDGAFRTDISVVVGLSAALCVMGVDGAISAWDGVILLLGGLAYGISLVTRRHAPSPSDQVSGPQPGSLARSVVIAAVGAVGLALGGRALVIGAIEVSGTLGVSSGIIGLTIVAIGTSLPEVATTISAVRRKNGGLAVGNILGSCVFNVASVIGLSAIVGWTGLPYETSLLTFHTPLALVAAVMLYVILGPASRNRIWGAVLLTAFSAYIYDTLSGHPTPWVWTVLGAISAIVSAPAVLNAVGLRRRTPDLGPKQKRQAA